MNYSDQAFNIGGTVIVRNCSITTRDEDDISYIFPSFRVKWGSTRGRYPIMVGEKPREADLYHMYVGCIPCMYLIPHSIIRGYILRIIKSFRNWSPPYARTWMMNWIKPLKRMFMLMETVHYYICIVPVETLVLLFSEFFDLWYFLWWNGKKPSRDGGLKFGTVSDPEKPSITVDTVSIRSRYDLYLIRLSICPSSLHLYHQKLIPSSIHLSSRPSWLSGSPSFRWWTLSDMCV